MIISPENMTALASHASAALDLVEVGVIDESVKRALAEGEQFCQFLERGASARTSEYFSAVNLAAGDYTNFVVSMPGGDLFQARVPQVKQKLELVIGQINEVINRVLSTSMSYKNFSSRSRNSSLSMKGSVQRLMENARKSG